MFILIILIFVGWIVLNNIEHESERKRKLESEKYWASPEGIKEKQRIKERAEEGRKWLSKVDAVRSFKKMRHQWCWVCKYPIDIKINTEAPIYFDNEEEEELFNKELNRIVCPHCHWIICDNCKSCKCKIKRR